MYLVIPNQADTGRTVDNAVHMFDLCAGHTLVKGDIPSQHMLP